MSKIPIRSALLAASMLAAAGPASAQFYGGYYGSYYYNAPPPPGPAYGYDGRRFYGEDPYRGAAEPRPLPPRAIVERLEAMGYEDVGRPRFTGTLYIVDATGPGDIRLRVVVDAIRGVVLNRTALGDPRRFGLREELDDTRRDGRRFTGRSDDEDADQDGPRRRQPGGRREASRGTGPAPGERGIASPADPRLAPQVDQRPGADPRLADPRPGAEQRPAPEPKPAPRSASRTQPGVARPSGTSSEGQVSGTNPDAAPRRGGPVNARLPANPSGTAVVPPPSQTRNAGEARAGRPVRVIGGVTPMSQDSAKPPTAAGASPGSTSGSLDALPPPPTAEPPTGLN